MSVNTATISGRVGKDAELRSTGSGFSVCGFAIAVEEYRKDKDNYTSWIDCTMFGVKAEKLAQYITKGTKLAVSGHLHQERWEKDGANRSRLVLVVDDVEFMSGGNGAQNGSQSVQKEMGTVTAEAQFGVRMEPVYDGTSSIYDEDIPF